ncbi:unnamed protein product [Symbiodinium natans]|uniref:Uncharacterized protein n=1 Tax=Symbiodinium natans TaxID=878477 RepID=A0A812SZH4_9DINO|nr:unnamed protein product [Symbiodinium natans]
MDDDDDADAALEKFFEEDALLEALQDAPDMEAQAEAFKARSEGSRQKDEKSSTRSEGPQTKAGLQMRATASAAQASREPAGPGHGSAPQSFDVEAPGAPGAPGPGRRRAKGRSWRGTMAVILVSLVIWAILMAIWSPAELWPHVPEVSVATEGLVKEMARNTPRPIQLPGHSSANETRAAGPRARVNVSWSSLDISGNATDAVAENSTGGGRPVPFRRKGRRVDGIGH